MADRHIGEGCVASLGIRERSDDRLLRGAEALARTMEEPYRQTARSNGRNGLQRPCLERPLGRRHIRREATSPYFDRLARQALHAPAGGREDVYMIGPRPAADLEEARAPAQTRLRPGIVIAGSDEDRR